MSPRDCDFPCGRSPCQEFTDLQQENEKLRQAVNLGTMLKINERMTQLEARNESLEKWRLDVLQAVKLYRDDQDCDVDYIVYLIEKIEEQPAPQPTPKTGEEQFIAAMDGAINQIEAENTRHIVLHVEDEQPAPNAPDSQSPDSQTAPPRLAASLVGDGKAGDPQENAALKARIAELEQELEANGVDDFGNPVKFGISDSSSPPAPKAGDAMFHVLQTDLEPITRRDICLTCKWFGHLVPVELGHCGNDPYSCNVYKPAQVITCDKCGGEGVIDDHGHPYLVFGPKCEACGGTGKRRGE